MTKILKLDGNMRNENIRVAHVPVKNKKRGYNLQTTLCNDDQGNVLLKIKVPWKTEIVWMPCTLEKSEEGKYLLV